MTRKQTHAHVERPKGLAWWAVWMLLVVGSCRVGEAATATKEHTKMKNESDAGPVQVVRLVVEAEPKYLLGFPLVVAVTFDNSRGGWNHYGLPMLDLFTEGAVLELDLEPVAAGKAMRTGSLASDALRGTFDLGPGQVRRMIWDLSNIGVPISPGVYRLVLRLRFAGRESASPPLTVELAQPPADQAAEATRLRRLGRTRYDSGSWVPFLTARANAVVLAPCLGEAARRQLALHLFLHRSIHSSKATALLDASSLHALAGPVLSPEAGALEYEILDARRDSQARDALGNTILKKWPGMAERLESVRKGRGTISTARKRFGVDGSKTPR